VAHPPVPSTHAEDDLTSAARAVLAGTLSDPDRARPLHSLAAALDALHALPRALPDDDEVLNWAFTEAIDQLRAAWWCLAGGAYPTALLAARGALRTGLASVAWHDAENCTLQPSFTEWEAGAPLPSIEALVAWLDANASVAALGRRAGLDLAGHVREIDAALSDERRHHHLHNGWSVPGHAANGHAMAGEALWEVVGTLGAAWLTLYPSLARGVSDDVAQAVFRHPWPASVRSAVVAD